MSTYGTVICAKFDITQSGTFDVYQTPIWGGNRFPTCVHMPPSCGPACAGPLAVRVHRVAGAPGARQPRTFVVIRYSLADQGGPSW